LSALGYFAALSTSGLWERRPQAGHANEAE